jgi:hypothetical protein
VLRVEIAKADFPQPQPTTLNQSTNFSDKEKDEASLPDGFRQDSLDAFILRFAGV